MATAAARDYGSIPLSRGVAAVQFSYGHSAVGVSRRDPGR